MEKPGLTILIPCLNEARTIAQSVREARRVLDLCGGQGEVLVVDNCSRDRSAELARQEGARVVSAKQRGYGFALRRGFEEAAFPWIAMVDADLSYPIDKIPELFSQAVRGYDFILGNRLRGDIEKNAMPLLNRYLGTPVLSVLLRRLHAIPTYDCNSGLRVFRKADIHAMGLTSGGMELASEMLVRAAQLKLKYAEVVIPFFRDQRAHRSHLNRWQDGMRHLRLICKSKFNGAQAAGRHQRPQQNTVDQRI